VKKKPPTQEELELAYDSAWAERPDGKFTFPSEGPMPVPRKGSDIEQVIEALDRPLISPELVHHWSDDHWFNSDDNLKPTFLDETKAEARKRKQKFVDPVDPLNDNIPDFLRSSAVDKEPENVQEHKAPEVATRRVTLLKDHTLEYPLLGLSIFVAGDWDVPDDEQRFARMFARSYCRGAKSPDEADLVIFGGGSDVDPQLYGEKQHDTTYCNPARDYDDGVLFDQCYRDGIAMLGICRGAQYLHVRNNGKLYQDVDEHYGPHTMWDIRSQRHLEKVSSVHHQMVMPNPKGGMEIIATTAKSKTRALKHNEYEHGNNADIEAFFYRETCCIGIQGHPEYEGYNYFTNWCLELVMELVYCNPDFDWNKGRLRMKKEVMEQRALAHLPVLSLKEELKGL
jgi:gamma-glutamyl-gamma-aminobutyrate hydrolase PuuD